MAQCGTPDDEVWAADAEHCRSVVAGRHLPRPESPQHTPVLARRFDPSYPEVTSSRAGGARKIRSTAGKIAAEEMTAFPGWLKSHPASRAGR